MEYNEIDQHVDQLFRQTEAEPKNEVLHGEVLSGDWRSDRLYQAVQEAYNDALWQIDHKISGGNLRDNSQWSPVDLPWNGNIEGMADKRWPTDSTMESCDESNNANWSHYNDQIMYFEVVQRRNLTIAEWVMIGIVGLLMLLIMTAIS